MDPRTDTITGTETEREIRGRLGELVSGVKDSVYENAQKLKSKSAADLYNGSIEYVKHNPGKTLLVAFAAGLVLGSLLRRGPRD